MSRNSDLHGHGIYGLGKGLVKGLGFKGLGFIVPLK